MAGLVTFSAGLILSQVVESCLVFAYVDIRRYRFPSIRRNRQVQFFDPVFHPARSIVKVFNASASKVPIMFEVNDRSNERGIRAMIWGRTVGSNVGI